MDISRDIGKDYQSSFTYRSHTVGNNYNYDQLNRLTMMRSFDNLDATNNAWLASGTNDGTSNYHTRYGYATSP